MKKISAIILCALSLCICVSASVFAVEEVENTTNIEHIKMSKMLARKAPTNIVQKTDKGINILPYNTMQVIFAQNFEGKTAKIGDEVVFLLKDGLYTEEGTEILPPSTKLVAEISNLEHPQIFNKCGKVYLDFKYIELPDKTQKSVNAKLFSKNEFLSRGKLNAWVKGFGNAFGTSALGTAAGCGIGIATNAVLLGGMAIGLPIGAAAGSIIGFTTPGLHFRAKAGDKVIIQLTDNVSIEK